jgi:phospho-N-acetylmuramoyl-pentapeptide-transferase
MLYDILYPLKTFFSPLNVVGYITFRSIASVITALVLTFVFGKVIIAKLKSKHIIQIIRADGPLTHLAKSGTPTMGGILILTSMLISTLLWARLDNRFILWALGCTLWLGMLGTIDDYLKVIKKSPKGVPPSWKLAGQFGFAAAVSVYLFFWPQNPAYATSVNIPYLKNVYVDLSLFYLLFASIVIVGSSNAVNLTDGLDGLAIGNIIICAFVYAIFSYLAGHARFSSYLGIIPVHGAGELAVFLSAMVGAGLGFLWFNGYPAEVFMGDSGSLFLGGTIGLVAVFIKQEIILLVVGGVFVMEILSVMLQVYNFKRTGKRIFRMTPIHHHFELSGWAEPKVTVRFWIIGIVLALVAITSLKLR